MHHLDKGKWTALIPGRLRNMIILTDLYVISTGLRELRDTWWLSTVTRARPMSFRKFTLRHDTKCSYNITVRSVWTFVLFSDSNRV